MDAVSDAIELDGAQQSGSGTLVRFGVAFASVLGRELHVVRARARRAKPGLRAQHVAALHAAAELCGGSVEGARVGAGEFRYRPGPRVRGGSFAWDIGTAGSATMLALGVLPIACLAAAPVRARIRGGVCQDFAPSPYHLAQVLAPLLARCGAQVELEVLRPGYVPGGEGEIELRVRPAARGLAALDLRERGEPGAFAGVALSSHLEARGVSERMASTCEAALEAAGLSGRIARVHDEKAAQAGACLAAWLETSGGARLGADRAGAPRRSSEAIGRFVARSLLEDLRSGASVDRHAADQLVVFAALARGTSRFVVAQQTAHLASNLWLAAHFGARFRRDGRGVEIDGLAFAPGG
jgi:RNA 3'-terminal phosphate cyclase (ATP)